MACTTKLMQVCHTWEWSPTQIFPVVRKVCCRWPPAVDQTRNLLDFLVAMFLGGIQHAIMVTTFLRSDTLLLLVFVCQLFEGGVYKKKCIELSFTLLINLWYWQSANLYQQWLTGERPAVFSNYCNCSPVLCCAFSFFSASSSFLAFFTFCIDFEIVVVI